MTTDHLCDLQASELLLQHIELFDQDFPFSGAPHLAQYHVWKIVFDWLIFIQMPENVTFWRISSPLMLGHSECWPGFLNAWLLQSVFKECSLASQVSGLRCSSSHSLLVLGAMLPPFLMVFLYYVLWSWTLYLLSAYGSKPIQRRAINCRAALSSLVRLSRTNIWRIFWNENQGSFPIACMET